MGKKFHKRRLAISCRTGDLDGAVCTDLFPTYATEKRMVDLLKLAEFVWLVQSLGLIKDPAGWREGLESFKIYIMDHHL